MPRRSSGASARSSSLPTKAGTSGRFGLRVALLLCLLLGLQPVSSDLRLLTRGTLMPAPNGKAEALVASTMVWRLPDTPSA